MPRNPVFSGPLHLASSHRGSRLRVLHQSREQTTTESVSRSSLSFLSILAQGARLLGNVRSVEDGTEERALVSARSS